MRYKCIVSYDGSGFHGFQIQNNPNQVKQLRTVQLLIEKSLKKIAKKEIKIHPSGRTDTNVHAIGQVFHFDMDIDMDNDNMRNAINSRMPRDIYIRNVEKVDDSFHARYSKSIKEYKYIINLGEYDPLKEKYQFFYKYDFDFELFKKAGKEFVGEHDFKSFTKNHQIENTVRHIYSIDIKKEGDLVITTFKANGFLRNMIRIIIGIMIDVASKKMEVSDIKKIMDAKDRTLAKKTFPGNGLYLVNVEY